MPLFEYSCFLHPREKSSDRSDRCPQCNEIFDFPVRSPPPTIDGYTVEAGLSRGFYGAVYRARHSRTDMSAAFKVIPVATYAKEEDGGYNKPFDDEARLHLELSGDRLVARLEDWGLETLDIGGHSIPCHWMRMEYIDGRPLSDVIAEGPSSPREVAQIAWDLLDVIDMLQQRQKFHNDLHGDNVYVVELPESEARRQAIHPRLSLKVLDLGSAGGESRSTEQRLGDIHWVAQHILDLLRTYELGNDTIDTATQRLISQLRRTASYYLGVQRDRAPAPNDFKESIYGAWAYGERPWSQPVRLGSVGEHYNAQSLPAWFAPELLHDPDGRWTSRLTGAGPQLLTGMRGCGKTILLRSLEWSARTHMQPGEAPDSVTARVADDRFLGLFVSCAALLRKARAEALDVPVHRLFLAFCREVVLNVQICELKRIGEVDYNALPAMTQLVQSIIPWFEAPEDASSVVALEQALSRALHSLPSNTDEVADIAPRTAFDDLVNVSRRLVDIWANKILLLLLDDVSTRYLTSENVATLLSQLFLQSPEFGIKVSTESQTLELTTPGGETARSDRDYQTLDLGAEVFSQFVRGNGVAFLEGILSRRASVTAGAPIVSPSQLLGRQPLSTIAERIRTEPSKAPVYWGIDALAGICVGDIGDVLQLYESILDRRTDNSIPISPADQHRAAMDLCEAKLLALANLDDWLYSHAVAFAGASHREVKNARPDGVRQYTSIFIKMAPEEAPELFRRLIDLIDAGVFVLTGGTPRTKLRDAPPYVQFKLAFRTILGLTNRMPLSKRDRFEPAGDQIADWLNEPAERKLQVGAGTEKPSDQESQPDDADARDDSATGAPVAHEAQMDLFFRDVDLVPDVMPEPTLIREVTTTVAGDIEDIDMSWADAHVISAFGFEDRSLGAWERILARGAPRAATLVAYPDTGRRADIAASLKRARIPHDIIDAADIPDEDSLRALGISPGVPLVIDTTALTKALIYGFVRDALLARNEVWILHTCAERYHPPDSQLDDVMAMFDAKEFPDAFRRLDEAVAGEQGPFKTIMLGKKLWDPSHPSLLAAFVSLKHKRLTNLVSEMPVEAIAAIAPVHTAGRDNSRSVVNRRLAESLVQVHGGVVLEVGSLDQDGAYEALVNLHSEYALSAGYNFEVALSGNKMHAVGTAMFGSIATPSAVFYSAPARFEQQWFTSGTGVSRLFHLQRRERIPDSSDDR